MSWNPDQYLKFSQPRLQPALDLLARIPLTDPTQVCDLGCGTGNVTRILKKRWPRASITGVDESPEMLEQAARLPDRIEWVRQSIAAWRPEAPPDVIYSNAALHWLPNHHELLPTLTGFLAPGGILAVQMPRNFSAPSHALVAETVRCGPWCGTLEPLLHTPPVGEPQFYYELLAPLARQIDIWETEYLHILQGSDPVKEWVKGSWLRQFLDRLDASECAAFEQDYARRLRIAYPRREDGTTLLPFRRLFIVLERPSEGRYHR